MPKPNPLRQMDNHAPDIQPPTRHPWMDEALCTQTNPDLFFEASTERYVSKPSGARETVAKSICRRCPVLEDCRAWVTENPQEYGIWAGMTERERRQARKEAS